LKRWDALLAAFVILLILPLLWLARTLDD